MLKFEFIQPGEFDDPYYEVDKRGLLEYMHGEWRFTNMFTGYYAKPDSLRQIANKLDELNESTRAQRILCGWL